MSRRLLPLALVLGVSAAACAKAPVAPGFGSGPSFVPSVVDPLNDAGRYPSVVVVDGRPLVAYFSFAEEVPEGSFPQTRPIGSPSLPGVMLATVQDGIWTRGAIAIEKKINNVEVAFNPAFEESVGALTPVSVTGLQLVADAAGGLHAVWGSGDGVFYASGSADPSSSTQWTVEQVAVSPPYGPSLAVDADGNPWIAYATATSGSDVVLATKDGPDWTSSVVGSGAGCPGCRTAIAVSGDGAPVVAWGDGANTYAGVAGTDTWQTVERGGTGVGLAAAAAPDGSVVLTYETDAQVHAATGNGRGTWRIATVAELAATETAPPAAALATGVAADDAGALTVAWYDAAGGGVAAAVSSADGTFSPIELGLTQGAQGPSVATTGDGASRFIAWFESGPQDLVLGAYGDAGVLAIAEPSPTPTEFVPPTGAPPTQECAPVVDGKVTVVAVGIAFTDGSCIDAPAGEPFTIVFDNQDAGVQHNVQVFAGTEPSGDTLFQGEIITGPLQIEYQIPALDAGEYAYDCVVHPTMVGTIKVGGGGSTGVTGATGATGSMVMVTAQGIAFDTSTITLAADAENTIMFNNQDAGVQHNIAIYSDPSMTDEPFNGELITGVTSVEYTIPALPAGEYYFVCIAHPNMNGTVVVE